MRPHPTTTANPIFSVQPFAFRRIIARLFVMGGTNAQLPIGQQVFLPGHFALPVALEAAHPVPQGYECQVRLSDGTLKQIPISPEEAAALAAQPEKAKPHSRPAH